MIGCVPSATVVGVDGQPVSVEVHVSSGLPSFTVVGLPDASCREARDRVRAALLSSGLEWPMKRITVNLAPATVRKVGASLDLAIAVAVMLASGQVEPAMVSEVAFLGELGLDGALRPARGTLAMVGAITQPEVVVPSASVSEAQLVARQKVRCASHLGEMVAAVRGDEPWPDAPLPPEPEPLPPPPDLADVRGHRMARYALEVAAAGGHHLLMVGPPGAGKTMLASRLPGLLGPLGPAEALEVIRVHSVAGELAAGGVLPERPPFRAPHHSASLVSLVGGGSAAMRPGELSMAHGGVLFLDEMGEFDPSALDAMRQPLEEGVIRVSRAWGTIELPARVLLVGAMNPCPCGHGGSARCRCSDSARLRYARRLSGPLLDRFDLRLSVCPPAAGDLLDAALGEASATVAQRVASARGRAEARGVRSNSCLSAPRLEEVTSLHPKARELLEHALETGAVSPRGLRRVRSVALTIDDLEGGDGHLVEAVVARALALRCELGQLTGDSAWG